MAPRIIDAVALMNRILIQCIRPIGSQDLPFKLVVPVVSVFENPLNEKNGLLFLRYMVILRRITVQAFVCCPPHSPPTKKSLGE